MKAEISCEALRAPLEQAASAIGGRKGVEILTCALIELTPDEVIVTCTDLERQIVARQQSVSDSQMKVCVPAKRLLDVLKLLPVDSGLKLSLGKEMLSVKHGTGTARFQTRDTTEYPVFDLDKDSVSLEVSAAELRRALRRVLPACAKDDVRYYLNGVCFDLLPNGLTLIGTNGHRLHKADLAVGTEQSCELIVPRLAAQDLMHHLPDSNTPITLEFGVNTLSVAIWGSRFSTRLIAGKYPQWRRIFQDDGPVRVQADREAFLATLNRINLFCEKEGHGMSVEVAEQKLRMQSRNPDSEAVADEELEAETHGVTQMGFAVPYLMDALTACETERVEMRCAETSAGAGAFFHAMGETEDGFGAYVCQMRL